MINEEFEIEDDTVNENEEFRYSITSYGADYTIDSIVARIEKEKIYVPSFQRKYVWKQVQASRFIESLILGLPVPGVFLSTESETGKLLIVDGQQRMLSIANFYKGVFGERKFRLKGVQEDLEGKTYEELNEADQNRLDDSILHATVIKQDTPDDNDSSIYMIFERLNTGGTVLQPQEIRACVYHGELNELLSDLICNTKWRLIFGKENARMKEQELILRFFSLYYNYVDFKKILKSFINTFMSANRNFKRHSKQSLTDLFNRTIDVIFEALNDNSFKTGNRINAAVFDSVMIGVATRLELNSSKIDIENLKIEYDKLRKDENYITFVSSSTASETSVFGRISMSINAFKNI